MLAPKIARSAGQTKATAEPASRATADGRAALRLTEPGFLAAAGDRHEDPRPQEVHPPDRAADFSAVPVFAADRAGRPRLRAPSVAAMAVAGTVQPKLAVGRVDDPLERAADGVADQVMRMPDTAASTGEPAVQHECQACQEGRSEACEKGQSGACEEKTSRHPQELARARVVEIFTSYAATGPDAGRDPLTNTSAYGRGSTAADKAAGTTSLRFHESQHGQDFLDFLASHPFPVFTGKVGQTTHAFRQARTDFLAQFESWAKEMVRVSRCATDCVGSPDIDTFEHNTGPHMKCTTCHP